jgi:putative protease
MSKSKVGVISHYFTKIGVAVIDLTGSLNIGDTISIQGATTSFEQVIDSMQIEHEMVDKAKGGDSIGLKVKDRVRKGDTVFKIG